MTSIEAMKELMNAWNTVYPKAETLVRNMTAAEVATLSKQYGVLSSDLAYTLATEVMHRELGLDKIIEERRSANAH